MASRVSLLHQTMNLQPAHGGTVKVNWHIINTRRTAIFNYLEGRNASIDAKFSKLPNYHVARKKALQLLKIFLIKDCFDVLLN